MAFAPRRAAKQQKQKQQPASDVQERVKEIKSRQNAWLQQRDHSIGDGADDADSDHASSNSRTKDSESRDASANASVSFASRNSSSLLDRVRIELDDIEREVRRSAGLPAAAAAAAVETADSAFAPATAMRADTRGSQRNIRPVSHECQQCRALMRAPKHVPLLLQPCGHTVCKQCYSAAATECPECGCAIAGARPNAALDSAIRDFCHNPQTRSNDQQIVWAQQLEVISSRMRKLEGSMDSLQAEAAQLAQQLQQEAQHDAQLAEQEQSLGEEIQRLSQQLRRVGEQREASRSNSEFIQQELQSKHKAIQAAFASQQLVSQELAKLQRLCSD